MRFRVTYHRSRELLLDHEQQMARGGLMVRVLEHPSLELQTPVELEIDTPSGRCTFTAVYLQDLPGAGVALGFAVCSELKALIDAAGSAADRADQDPVHELVSPPPRGRAELAAKREPPVELHTRIKSASHHERMQLAMRGPRDVRSMLLRDPTAKALHPYVLKNPKLQLDEVAAIAGMRTVSVDTLKLIAARREWCSRPEVASALVRNPKTPVPIAIRSVAKLSPTDTRALAKGGGLRAPIQRAVRKKALVRP